MSSQEDLVALFTSFGFDEKKSVDTVKNKKVSAALAEILKGLDGAKPDDKQLALLHQLAVESKTEIPQRDQLVQLILNGGIKSNLQIAEAAKYLRANPDANAADISTAAGVGQEVSDEDAKAIIEKFIESNSAQIEAERYQALPKMLAEARKLPELKWGLPAVLKPTIDALFLAKIGPKDERDVVKKEKKKKAPAAKKEAAAPAPERLMFSEGWLGELHKPGDQPQKYPELMKAEMEATGGKVFTRFPPEPNGFLHIGHLKAIMVNFGYAKYNDGCCYLRFDDTNPEAEEEVYFNLILDMVSWLGFTPFKVTYSLDYFDQLYALAERLIELGHGYVCMCTTEEMKQGRGLKADGTLGGERHACAHRSKLVEQNLKEFRGMRDGEYEVGAATLRMKQDLDLPLPQMWDLVAYRVLNAPHHRTGDKWRIYPTYDFTHCLVDLFEHITHSLCTTEFQLLRELYEWLCDVLKVYRPAQREYGRLNITGTVLSKRKIAKLVNEGHVRGWNDPRLFTLEAIRRRGVPPGAILLFINTLGVTTLTTNIQVVRFELAVRAYLDGTTPRLMMVVQPVEVVIDNVDADWKEEVDIPYKPGDDLFGLRKITLTKKFYIDASDVIDTAPDKEYFRLAPGQPVGLMKVSHTILLVLVEKNADGTPARVHVNYDADSTKKPKTYIQWVPEHAVDISEVRVYNQLFKLENPQGHPDGFLADINPDLELVIHGAKIEPAIAEIAAKLPLNHPVPGLEFNIKEKPGNNTVRFQALRLGYFCLDTDSSNDKLVMNRIVTLKEDSHKK